ncbi:Endogenous Retrovirus Group K Member 5 Gag Polyprotein [Manis pentadactyla]|nr:Endogenous Retrovirus Group K Member 5 Gag Polyprotein [Manis pentadactyla]
MGQAGNKQLYVCGLKKLLAIRGIIVGKPQFERFLDFIKEVCLWFPGEGTVDIDLWNKVGEGLQTYYSAHGPKKVPVDIFGLWTLIRDSLDLRHEGFKIENVKEHALGIGQATKENKSNLASPAISPSAPPLESLEGREPSYHEPDSGSDEEMEEEQSPLVEEALVQLCDKEIQTIEIASIGSSKKVYPSLLTATWTVATDPSGIPFKERWNEIQGTLKRLTLALEAQQKKGQLHPERRDSLVSKAETAPLEMAGFDPVQPISSEQTKEKTVERKTEKGLEQKEKQPIESKEEKPRVLPVNMQKRQRKVTPLEAVLQQAQDQGEDTQEFFAYPVLERPGDNGEVYHLINEADYCTIALEFVLLTFKEEEGGQEADT